jgi:ubiquinone/menaquinone biosynthesis C-methylase UbiE
MKFYKELSKVYDIVFQKDEDTLKFLLKGLKVNSKILDLACGTGTYSIALAQKGHRVDGIDLGEEMIKLAKGKGGVFANFVVGDMTKLSDNFPDERYDMVFCIGNSIVHLKNKEKIEQLILEIYKFLNYDGSIIIQIVNFDRVIAKQITALPTIDRSDKGVKFIRNYNLNEEGKIDFQTELIVKKDEGVENFLNSVPLVPLQSYELIAMLEKAGFQDIDIYGGFKEEEFNEDSFALVVKAIKR